MRVGERSPAFQRFGIDLREVLGHGKAAVGREPFEQGLTERLRLHATAPSLGEAPIVVDLAPERANGLALGPGMECRLHLPVDRLRLYAGAPR